MGRGAGTLCVCSQYQNHQIHFPYYPIIWARPDGRRGEEEEEVEYSTYSERRSTCCICMYCMPRDFSCQESKSYIRKNQSFLWQKCMHTRASIPSNKKCT